MTQQKVSATLAAPGSMARPAISARWAKPLALLLAPVGLISTASGVWAAESPSGIPVASYGGTPGMTPWQSALSPRTFYTVAYGAGRFVALTEAGESEVFTSTDGASWSKAGYAFGRHPGWLTYRSGAFVCIASWDNNPRASGKPSELAVATSPDGTTWTPRTAVANGERFRPLLQADGAYVHVGPYGTILFSKDGVAWTLERRVTYADLNRVAFGAGRFVAVGKQGTILTSPDGLRWSKRLSGITEELADVIYAGGRFVALARARVALGLVDGVVLSSKDGISWTRDFSAKGNELRALAYGAGQYVAVGGTGSPRERGTVLTSRSAGPAARDAAPNPDNGTIVGLLAPADYRQLSVVKVTPAGETSISNPIAPSNADVYSYPQLEEHAATADDLVPAGWTVELSASGDLDGDARDDVVFVMRESGAGIVLANPTADEGGLRIVHPRMLVVALKDPRAQQLHVVAHDTHMLPPQTAAYDMSWELRVVKGVLEVQFSATFPFSSMDDPEIVKANATYKFRYEREAIGLIGAELTAGSEQKQWHERMSVNLLTGKKVTENRARRREVERFERPAPLPALGAIKWSRKNKVPEPELDPFLPPFIRGDW